MESVTGQVMIKVIVMRFPTAPFLLYCFLTTEFAFSPPHPVLSCPAQIQCDLHLKSVRSTPSNMFHMLINISYYIVHYL